MTDLQTGPTLPVQIKLNFVTVDDQLRALDALGSGAGDRFGFVRMDLRKETYLTITHAVKNALDPAFTITGGSVETAIP